jgi:predicted NBD/HSP70 family sugar kinase
MRYWVGIDVGKIFHWICVLDEEGEVVLSERVGASEEELDAVLSRTAELLGG